VRVKILQAVQRASEHLARRHELSLHKVVANGPSSFKEPVAGNLERFVVEVLFGGLVEQVNEPGEEIRVARLVGHALRFVRGASTQILYQV